MVHVGLTESSKRFVRDFARKVAQLPQELSRIERESAAATVQAVRDQWLSSSVRAGSGGGGLQRLRYEALPDRISRFFINEDDWNNFLGQHLTNGTFRYRSLRYIPIGTAGRRFLRQRRRAAFFRRSSRSGNLVGFGYVAGRARPVFVLARKVRARKTLLGSNEDVADLWTEQVLRRGEEVLNGLGCN